MSNELNAKEKAEILKVSDYKKHIFLCAGPECCASDSGEKVWLHLKKRLSELKLASPGGSGAVFRTKAHCLRICNEGPIAIIYPDGIWYKKVDDVAIDRIIDEHLIKGVIVEDLVLCRNVAMHEDRRE